MAKVRYESNSARRYQRVAAPAWVVWEGDRYPTADWSVGGIRISGYTGDAQVGEQRGIRFFVNFQGFEIGFDAKVEVRTVEPEYHQLSAAFVDLGPRETEMLRHFVIGLTTGEVSSVADTILHMDAPTSVAQWGAPSGAADPEKADRARRRRTLVIACYLVAGPLLAGYLALAAYQSFFRIEVDSAVVVRPMETIVAQGVGSLEQLYVREGQTVAKGQPLLTAVDAGYARDLEAKETELALARLELRTLEATGAAAHDKLKIYQDIAVHKQRVATERVNALTIECETAANQRARVERLVREGGEARALLDAATAAHARLKGQLNEAQAELKVAEDAIGAANRGNFYDGFRLVGDLPELLIAEHAAREKVRIVERQLRASRKASGRTTYSVPFSGRVVQVSKSAGSTVNRGETLALLERIEDEPRVQALLTQEQARHVRLGEQATVRVPTLRERYRAVVVRSDKSGVLPRGPLADLAPPERGRSSDLTAVIELELRTLDPDARGSLRSGMPAIVNLPRRSSGNSWPTLTSWYRK